MTFFDFLIVLLCSVCSAGAAYLILHRKLKSSQYIDKMLQLVQAEIAELVTEINAVTDRNVTIVDDRVKQIRILLQKSEKVIAGYKASYVQLKDLLQSIETQQNYVPLPPSSLHVRHETTPRQEEVLVPPAFSDDSLRIQSLAEKSVAQEILHLHVEDELDNVAIARKLSISETEVETALLFYMHKLKRGESGKDRWISMD